MIAFILTFIRSFPQLPSKRPAYRADRAHDQFLSEIGIHLPLCNRSPDSFSTALHKQISTLFSTTPGLSDVVSATGGNNSNAIISELEFTDAHEDLKARNAEFMPRSYYLADLDLK